MGDTSLNREFAVADEGRRSIHDSVLLSVGVVGGALRGVGVQLSYFLRHTTMCFAVPRVPL